MYFRISLKQMFDLEKSGKNQENFEKSQENFSKKSGTLRKNFSNWPMATQCNAVYNSLEY